MAMQDRCEFGGIEEITGHNFDLSAEVRQRIRLADESCHRMCQFKGMAHQFDSRTARRSKDENLHACSLRLSGRVTYETISAAKVTRGSSVSQPSPEE